MRYLLTACIVLALLVLGGFLFAISGSYDIAATTPHWGITSSFINMMRDRSIKVHSNDIQTPNLDDPRLKEDAFSHYHEMCRLCHGAPEFPPEEFAMGLYPVPPRMTSGHIQQSLSKAEIYWTIKHGIKMTGMPAFGPSHKENELWGLVALAIEISRMNPEHYMQQAKGHKDMTHGHTHGEQEREKDHGHGQSKGSIHHESENEHL